MLKQISQNKFTSNENYSKFKFIDLFAGIEKAMLEKNIKSKAASIKHILDKKFKNSQKEKFWKGNKDIFLRYFNEKNNISANKIYDSFIESGDFSSMEKIVKDNSIFDKDDFFREILKK